MTFDLGIYDTVFMVISMVLAAVVFFFVKPRNKDGNGRNGADE